MEDTTGSNRKLTNMLNSYPLEAYEGEPPTNSPSELFNFTVLQYRIW